MWQGGSNIQDVFTTPHQEAVSSHKCKDSEPDAGAELQHFQHLQLDAEKNLQLMQDLSAVQKSQLLLNVQLKSRMRLHRCHASVEADSIIEYQSLQPSPICCNINVYASFQYCKFCQ